MIRRSVTLFGLAVSTLAAVSLTASTPSRADTNVDADAVVKAVAGCHAIATLEVESANPKDAAVVGIQSATSVCLEDNKGKGGGAERVGVSVKATNGDVVGSWSFDVAEEPLRCKACYLLVGDDGKLDWDGAENAAKSSEPRIVTIRAKAMGSTFRLLLK